MQKGWTDQTWTIRLGKSGLKEGRAGHSRAVWGPWGHQALASEQLLANKTVGKEDAGRELFLVPSMSLNVGASD